MAASKADVRGGAASSVAEAFGPAGEPPGASNANRVHHDSPARRRHRPRSYPVGLLVENSRVSCGSERAGGPPAPRSLAIAVALIGLPASRGCYHSSALVVFCWHCSARKGGRPFQGCKPRVFSRTSLGADDQGTRPSANCRPPLREPSSHWSFVPGHRLVVAILVQAPDRPGRPTPGTRHLPIPTRGHLTRHARRCRRASGTSLVDRHHTVRFLHPHAFAKFSCRQPPAHHCRLLTGP